VIEWCYELDRGVPENVPVDIGIARPHRIVAAEWWGSSQVAAGGSDRPVDAADTGRISRSI